MTMKYELQEGDQSVCLDTGLWEVSAAQATAFARIAHATLEAVRSIAVPKPPYDARTLLPAMPVRCECGGPVTMFSTPPGGMAYGWCLACHASVEVPYTKKAKAGS